MIEQIVHCYMTSKDALDLAAKLREVEEKAAWGSDLAAYDWHLGPGEKIRFTVDQSRAERQGLMKL